MEVIAAVIGSPEPNSTKKMARWASHARLVVNCTRERTFAATVWMAGPCVDVSGLMELEAGFRLLEATPSKSSNHSPAIKRGPTVFCRARSDADFAALQTLLARLMEGARMSDIATIEPDGLEPEDDTALELGAGDRHILTQALDERVEGLVSRIRRGRLILQPDFQRDFVWAKAKSSRLIESILMRIPLPVLYVAELENGSWEVVDGQQRLTAIRSFVDGQFPDGEPFRLGALQVRSDLRGKSFKDLAAADQNAIEDYSLRVIKILKEAHPDLKFEVFERLNSGADKLNDMELRNCIYRGTYNDFLQELAGNEALLSIRGADAPDTRMRDRQLILRFFAMWRNTHLRYRGPMKQFMNHEMQTHRAAGPEEIGRMRRAFTDAIQCAWDVFGAHAFRRYDADGAQRARGSWDQAGKLNVALWDTILYVFTYYERRQILPVADAIYEEFLDLMTHDATFADYIGRTTDQPERVRYRADTWKSRLDALIDIPAGETRAYTRHFKEMLFKANPSCAICEQRIQELDDAEVDHLTHYWRGGRTLPENARLTHRFCNRRRGGGEDKH